jgi:hypothetical protein
MRTFRQLVDDGTTIASSAEDTFPNIDTAISETIKAAAMIAVEELGRKANQAFTCEVQDPLTGDRRRATVRFSVELD